MRKMVYSAETAAHLARALRRAWPPFPEQQFLSEISTSLDSLALKQRMHLLADRLELGLPREVPHLFSILRGSLAEDEQDITGVRGFLVWPLTEIVARHGAAFLPEAMGTLREMTIRFTGEFAIRSFLRTRPDQVFPFLHDWCADPNEHVRRLVSEGTRPWLPWGEKIPAFAQPPFPTLPLLEKLHADPSPYVRLSVANHLNDLSKSNPGVVLDTLERWRKMSAAGGEKLARHACRTLLKAGHPHALRFFGFNDTSFCLENFTSSPPTVKLGDAFQYSFAVRNLAKHAALLMFDYAVHFRKANGSLALKVFKGKIAEFAAGETKCFSGRHRFVPVTTRVYYPGEHRFEILLNGRSAAVKPFHLIF